MLITEEVDLLALDFLIAPILSVFWAFLFSVPMQGSPVAVCLLNSTFRQGSPFAETMDSTKQLEYYGITDGSEILVKTDGQMCEKHCKY